MNAAQPQELTHAQQRMVLETIAGRMDTINRLLMALQVNAFEEHDAGPVLDAAQFMAVSVGAMADDATGGGVCGDMRRWLYGPLFAGYGRQGGAA